MIVFVKYAIIISSVEIPKPLDMLFSKMLFAKAREYPLKPDTESLMENPNCENKRLWSAFTASL